MMSIRSIPSLRTHSSQYFLLSAAVSLVLLASCSYQSKMLTAEGSFTADALQKGGLALFGVIGSDLDYPADTVRAELIDSALARHFLDKLSFVPVCPPESTMLLITAPDYEFIKTHSGPYGILNNQSKALLAGKQAFLPEYIMIVMVEDERIWDEIDESGDRGTGYRHIKVRADIYNVASGKLVWSRRISHGGYKTSDRTSGLKIGGVSLGGDNWTDGPPPPDALEVLGEIFDNIASSLPQK